MEEVYTYRDFLFYALYACASMMAFAASLYLLLRRDNVFSDVITPPQRLRRWTAAFFAAAGASHLWWLLIRYVSAEGDLYGRILLCTAFDTITCAPILLCAMFVMLQDRRRPLWPIFAASAFNFVYLLTIYFLGIRSIAYQVVPTLLIFIFSVVLVRAVGQYDRWLLENYADLEHKEVRTSLGVLAAFLIISVSYGFANDFFFFEVFVEVANILLILLLLWRVETMQSLDPLVGADGEDTPFTADSIFMKLESLLQQHCVDQQFYLRHNASLTQLARMLGTNSSYLIDHFAQQGLNYNSYINGLRIQHFTRLCKERARNGQPIVATELATQSGFSSYSTFRRAFKRAIGQSLEEWMEAYS